MVNFMKNIVLKYYSYQNLGDDLFVVLLAKCFPNTPFNIIGNPIYIYKIKNRPHNLKVHYLKNTLLTTLSFLSNRILPFKAIYTYINKKIEQKASLYLEIGGSIFMESIQNSNMQYLTLAKLCSFEDALRDRKDKLKHLKYDFQNKVIIGANIGPVYTQQYLDNIREIISKYKSVCVRDLYSYTLCKDLGNVVYAPDVIFNLSNFNTPSFCENSRDKSQKKHIVFSIIDAKRKPELSKKAEQYYQLLADTISKLSKKYIIDLTAFCKREGDLTGIHECLKRLSDNCLKENIYIHKYTGNIDFFLMLFKQCDYIIASRFHSMILGLLYNKPIFPICYSAKMVHYLQDLSFKGKVAYPELLETLTVNDLLFNYKNNIICDCIDHKSQAYLQFESLNIYLQS